MRVLLVEDDDRLASALIAAIARHGHQVVRAGLAVDAVRLAGQVDFMPRPISPRVRSPS